MSDIFTVTAHKTQQAHFAEQLRVSLNRLAEEDPTFLDRVRERYRRSLWDEIFGPHIDMPEEK